MKHRFFSTIVLIFLFCSITNAGDSLSIATEKRLRKEYFDCTGDSEVKSINELLSWRETLHEQTRTDAYKAILKDYIALTGIKTGIVPCAVMHWQEKRVQKIAAREDSLSKKLMKENDEFIDTIYLQKQLADNPASQWDAQSIPFGISKKALGFYFAVRYGTKAEIKTNTVKADGLIIDSIPVSGMFTFDKADNLIAYQLDAPARSLDSLNSAIRPEAKKLIAWLTSKTHAPAETFRIGLFDIKNEVLTPYATWSDTGFSATAGIYSDGKMYNARMQVKKTTTK
jgi:hypothetical protein